MTAKHFKETGREEREEYQKKAASGERGIPEKKQGGEREEYQKKGSKGRERNNRK